MSSLLTFVHFSFAVVFSSVAVSSINCCETNMLRNKYVACSEIRQPYFDQTDVLTRASTFAFGVQHSSGDDVISKLHRTRGTIARLFPDCLNIILLNRV